MQYFYSSHVEEGNTPPPEHMSGRGVAGAIHALEAKKFRISTLSVLNAERGQN
jgi:hypothetical protein